MKEIKCDLCLKELKPYQINFLSVICNINFCEECKKDFEEESLKSNIIKASLEAF